MNENLGFTLAHQEQIAFVKYSNIYVRTNGDGELFVSIGDRTYRMCEREGRLHIVANKVEFAQYGGSMGVIL